MSQNCSEENGCCFSKLFKSLRVRLQFCLNELLANIYCAIRDVSYSIRLQTEEIEEIFENLEETFTHHHEVWSFDESVLIARRPICKIPLTAQIVEISFYTITKGAGQIKFNVYLDGTIILNNIASSLEHFTLPVGVTGSKFDLLEIEILDDDSYEPWEGLSCYVKYRL